MEINTKTGKPVIDYRTGEEWWPVIHTVSSCHCDTCKKLKRFNVWLIMYSMLVTCLLIAALVLL